MLLVVLRLLALTFLKYNLESIKNKAAHAIIDRMPFVHDVVTIVDLAACIYDESCPEIDCGLRKAIIVQVHARLSTIWMTKRLGRRTLATKLC